MGLFDHTLEVEGVNYSNPDVPSFEGQLWVASWSLTGQLEWFVTGYADDFHSLASIATAADGTVYVAGSVESLDPVALRFSNGLEGAMRFPSDPSGNGPGTDGFLASFEADGSARWLKVFGTNGPFAFGDVPAEVTVAGDVVALAHWGSAGEMVFDDRPDGTLEINGSVISTWDTRTGWRLVEGCGNRRPHAGSHRRSRGCGRRPPGGRHLGSAQPNVW